MGVTSGAGVGIDLSAKAVELVNFRLKRAMGPVPPRHVTERTDIPRRTDIELLCGHCNSTKGDESMAYLVARLRETGVLA